MSSITHVVNASDNTLAAEYSYDACLSRTEERSREGRMRNPATRVNYSPGTEPALFSGRGYTGHSLSRFGGKHLTWFKLINMNGKLYDPLSARFLSADKYIQAPDFTQSYNRYSYCLNNPLKYTDPSGVGWVFWIMGGITGGIRNVAINWDNIDNFGEGLAYFNVGGLAGSTGAVLVDMRVEAPGIGMACNWMLETGNALIEGASGSEVMEAGTQGALWGGASGFAVMGLNAAFNELMNIPWATNYQVPSRNNYHEVNLGDWLFGSQSTNIIEIIATLGTANATVILASFNSGPKGYN